MLDHIFLSVSDVERSIEFYTAALAPLGITARLDFDGSRRVHPAARDDERFDESYRQRSRAQPFDPETLEAQSVQAMLSYGFSSKSSSASLASAGSRTATSRTAGGVVRGAS